MKSRKKVRKRKSNIEDSVIPERPKELEHALGAIYKAGLRPYKLTFFYKSRTGLPVLIGNHDPEYFYNEIYVALNGCIETYIQSEFGSGDFEVAIYDESNIELGRYSYRIGGAPEYVHPSEAEDEEDFQMQLLRIYMENSRKQQEMMLAYLGYNVNGLNSNSNSAESGEDNQPGQMASNLPESSKRQ